MDQTLDKLDNGDLEKMADWKVGKFLGLVNSLEETLRLALVE